MKKTSILFCSLALAAASTTALAAPVTSEDALARVVAQWNAGGAHRAPMQASALTLVETGNAQTAHPSYYIFARAQGGFVVASADDAQPAILAYVDEGRYDADKMPPAFHAWLDEITEYGAALAPAAKAQGVDQLLGEIAWTQDTPMNDQCPRYNYVFNINDDDNDNDNDDIDGTVQDYVMECVDYGADAVRRDVKVRFEGSEVYIQGISEEVPEGWAHATLKDGVAIFETPLLLGEWNYYGSMRKQYITGADTGTGDVSGLEMLYDDDSRSFTSFSNNWILLTGDPTQVGYYYDHLYNSISFIPANQAGDSPTITPPDGLATTTYQLCGRHPYSGIPTDYTVNVGFDGSELYVQGLYPAFPNTWVKGAVADGKATFKTPQYIGNYHGLYNMYVAGVDPSREELCALVMDYDAATHTFTTTEDCWFIVQAGETNVLPMMLLDEVSIAPYKAPALDYTDLQLPAELAAKAQPYSFSATDADNNAPVSATAQVVLDGSDVYVKGLSTYFPDAWVKGHRDGTIIVFPRNQHMGQLQGNDIWLGAGDAMSGEMLYGNFILQLNPVTGELSQPEVNYLAINASTTKVYQLELYKGVKLTPTSSDGVGSVTNDAKRAPVYDLSGRPLRTAPKGIVISEGRKVRM